MPRVVQDGINFANEWEAADARRVEAWRLAGTVRQWWYGLRIPLWIMGSNGLWLPVLTRTGRQAIHRTDVVAWFADDTLEVRETKSARRSGPEYERWWLKHQILRAMGVHAVIIGRDGQPVEDVA